MASCPLMALPRELRDTIWRYFVQDEPLKISKDGLREAAMMTASKQVCIPIDKFERYRILNRGRVRKEVGQILWNISELDVSDYCPAGPKWLVLREASIMAEYDFKKVPTVRVKGTMRSNWSSLLAWLYLYHEQPRAAILRRNATTANPITPSEKALYIAWTMFELLDAMRSLPWMKVEALLVPFRVRWAWPTVHGWIESSGVSRRMVLVRSRGR